MKNIKIKTIIAAIGVSISLLAAGSYGIYSNLPKQQIAENSKKELANTKEDLVKNEDSKDIQTIEKPQEVQETTTEVREEVVKNNGVQAVSEAVKEESKVNYKNESKITEEKKKNNSVQVIRPQQKPVETPNNKPTETPNNKPVDSPSYTEGSAYIAEIEQAIFQRVNEERSKAGLAPLSYNGTMEYYGRLKSKDMGDRGYFDHKNPEGQLITEKMKADGVSYSAWGENIAYIQGQSGNASLANQFMTNWMNSSGHRANILSTNFTSIGVGVYKIGNTYYATQEFYR